MLRALVALVAAATLASGPSRQLAPAPISLHPDNPRYFLFRGEPTVLITSGEHYGAVLNADFDYRSYLDTLARNRFNQTRVFSGSYVETSTFIGALGHANTLAPRPGRLVSPWARSSVSGYAGGGNRFDLDRWNPAYFARLRGFVREAGRRGIVVELVLFSAAYTDGNARLSPMHISSNVNRVGGRLTFGGDAALERVQTALARKLVRELRPFDNVYFEVLNEPYRAGCDFYGASCPTRAFQQRILAAIAEEEASLSRKHLVAVNVGDGELVVRNLDRRVGVVNFHYATPAAALRNRHLRRPVAHDETGGRGTSDAPYRAEGWAFLLSGGAVFSNLDWSFAPGHERGTLPLPAGTPGGGGPSLRRQIGVLRDFLNGFDFLRMRPLENAVRGLPAGVRAHVLGRPGREYAVYVHGGRAPRLLLTLPKGRYSLRWVDPETGRTLREARIEHGGGTRAIAAPQYETDVALAVRRR